MGKELLTYDDLLQIVELIKSAEAFSEFHLKIGEIELDLRKSGAGVSSPAGSSATIPSSPASTTPSSAAATPSHARATAPSQASATASPAAAVQGSLENVAPASGTAKPTVDIPSGSVVIRSPMVGTFYRSPEPGAKPFVEVGQAVTPDTTVCIIEVMKLMNSISAGSPGRVTHVLVDDAEPVDMGQALILIDPKG